MTEVHNQYGSALNWDGKVGIKIVDTYDSRLLEG